MNSYASYTVHHQGNIQPHQPAYRMQPRPSPNVDQVPEDKVKRELINQPLLFSIDYILNLAAKEQQQQQQHSYSHNYLSQMAQIQTYHHQQQQLQQQQQQQDQQHNPQYNPQLHQKDNRKVDINEAQDCRKKKGRTVFTKPQVMHLEQVFGIKKYLTCFERSQLAGSMSLSETQIKIWFQNRRNKFKRELHSSYLGLSTSFSGKQ